MGEAAVFFLWICVVVSELTQGASVCLDKAGSCLKSTLSEAFAVRLSLPSDFQPFSFAVTFMWV